MRHAELIASFLEPGHDSCDLSAELGPATSVQGVMDLHAQVGPLRDAEYGVRLDVVIPACGVRVEAA